MTGTLQHTREYLLRHNIKPSVQRIAIMDYLIKNRTHPTADEIYSALCNIIPTLSKTTVYNTLKLFTEQKALMMLVIDEKNARFDIDVSEHGHFQCQECGHIFDVPSGGFKAEYDYPVLKELTVTEVHLYYKGYCNECSKRRNIE